MTGGMELNVGRIPAKDAVPWIMHKHYAKRRPSIAHAFGLFDADKIVGVCSYGIPATNALNTVAGFPALELNRLVLNEAAPHNAASILVGRSLRLLPKPLVVVSYADSTMSHVGYVYQATNWIYTGFVRGDTEYRKDGRTYHRKALFNIYKTGARAFLESMGYEAVPQGGKHRYVFFCGSKGQRRLMKEALPWPVLPYPKGTPSRYDSGNDL